ncbi:hypothetical protein [Streptacidiphilus sp. P02-A3a]|uniref:hypothetical protein n=1 Tax=Streptacidiphilus sp. P02-A3a TaxID=2704468 RepID=UPI0015F80818|nr:hypothetical protein [Streptacidiphilus sp. P02-A3a]QMU70987.1 hypothetical protein GXP74_24955 [Streptacidiphilus sp. P02-A3a]
MAAVRLVLRLLAAVGLAIDAGIHAKLAPQYDAVSASISQGTLFRIEAGAAALAVLLVLLWRRRVGDVFALLTAAAGIAALLVYRYVDVGKLGPLPNMYEPVWFSDKVWALIGQALAVLALLPLLPRRRADRPRVD